MYKVFKIVFRYQGTWGVISCFLHPQRNEQTLCYALAWENQMVNAHYHVPKSLLYRLEGIRHLYLKQPVSSFVWLLILLN